MNVRFIEFREHRAAIDGMMRLVLESMFERLILSLTPSRKVGK